MPSKMPGKKVIHRKDNPNDVAHLQALIYLSLIHLFHLDQMGEVEYAPGEPKGTP